MPTPLRGEEFTFKQPDGTDLRVRGWGNQYHAVFETLDGYTVVKNPETGFYQYASISPDGSELMATAARPELEDPKDLGLKLGIRLSKEASRAKVFGPTGISPGKSRWEQRLRERKQALRGLPFALDEVSALSEQPRVSGEFIGLCLLVKFPDVCSSIEPGQVERFCNEEGIRNSPTTVRFSTISARCRATCYATPTSLLPFTRLVIRGSTIRIQRLIGRTGRLSCCWRPR